MMSKPTNSTSSLSAKTTVLYPTPVPAAPVLYYEPHIWNQIRYIIDVSPKEVGWWGRVEKCEGGYKVVALYVPSQTVHSAETDISSEAMADLALEIINEGHDPQTLYYWGHSHVNMGVSPSGQDETQVREYLASCPVFIRGIYNKQGASKVDIYDVEANVCFESVVNKPAHPELTADDKKSIDDLLRVNVKQHVPKTTPYVYDTYRNNWGYPNTGHKDPTPVTHNTQQGGHKPKKKNPEGEYFLIGGKVEECINAHDVWGVELTTYLRGQNRGTNA